jgi:hypothetical protein
MALFHIDPGTALDIEGRDDREVVGDLDGPYIETVEILGLVANQHLPGNYYNSVLGEIGVLGLESGWLVALQTVEVPFDPDKGSFLDVGQTSSDCHAWGTDLAGSYRRYSDSC